MLMQCFKHRCLLGQSFNLFTLVSFWNVFDSQTDGRKVIPQLVPQALSTECFCDRLK